MADVSISYKDATIAQMSASGTKTLLTADNYCENNIVVEYTRPTASDLVSGTLSITENGTDIDVTNYANVNVNVSGGSSSTETCTVTIQDGGIVCSNFSNGIPTGTYAAIFNITILDLDSTHKTVGVFIATEGATSSSANRNTALFINDPSIQGFFGYVVGYQAYAYADNQNFGGDATSDIFNNCIGTYTATIVKL